MDRLLAAALFPSLILLLASPPSGQQISPTAPAERVASTLPAPALAQPAHGTVFTHFPREIEFRWEDVHGAVKYGIEVDCYHCCDRYMWCSDVRGFTHVTENLREPNHTHVFVGDQPGRWRVWGMDAAGHKGAKSDWGIFYFISWQSYEPLELTRPDGRETGKHAIYPLIEGRVLPKPISTPNPKIRGHWWTDVQGIVMLEIVLNQKGRVEGMTVRQSLDPAQDMNAIYTVLDWKFEPARKEGKPVAVRFPVKVTFGPKQPAATRR